jgi:hypothetical protein
MMVGPTHVRDEGEYRGDNVFSPLPWFTVHFSNDSLNETEGVPSYRLQDSSRCSLLPVERAVVDNLTSPIARAHIRQEHIPGIQVRVVSTR